MSNDNIITKTNDGYVVEIFAKVDKEIKAGAEYIAEGVTFLEPATNKTEEEQFVIYEEIVEKMAYSPVTIKATEDKETLKAQLKAILRAGKNGDLSIMFSGIASVIDLKEIKEILEECKDELKVQNLPYRNNTKIGVVVEISAVALMSYELARECDFFFIDTNSLINYMFGKKLNKLQLSDMTRKMQLATIKLIRQTVEGAHDAGIFCGICGEIVENPSYIPLLIGAGIDQFTVETDNVLNIRNEISKIDKYDCKEFTKEILMLKTTEELENKLKQFRKD